MKGVTRCNCLRPCVRDLISYKLHTDTTDSSNESLRFWILNDRLGQGGQRVEVLTYGREDLLADIGGYLGLLLGVSLHSLYGGGQRLVRRLAKRALHRGKRRQSVTEADPGDGTEQAGGTARRRENVNLPQHPQSPESRQSTPGIRQ